MKSFVYAFKGIIATIKNERNMRIHIVVAFYVLAAGIITGISNAEWAAVLLCIGIVMMAECINTAIEELCDAVHPEESTGIGFAKDAAAGGVLISALAAAVVGGIVFFNSEKVNAALDFYKTDTIPAIILTALLIPAIFFVRGKKKVKKT